MDRPYLIAIADDHVLFREGIKRIIQEIPRLAISGEAADGIDLLQLLEEATPDMVILDITMPRLQGLEAVKIIKGLYPEIKILILTMHKEKDYLYRAMNNGADGYLLKEDAHDVLLTAIDTIRQGKTFISPLLFG